MPATETWVSPAGVPVTIKPVAFEPYVPADDEDYFDDAWFPEEPGQRPPQRYLIVAVADGTTVDDRTVFPYAPWSAYDAIADILLAEGYEPPPLTAEELAECEHGMSAINCSGPNHFGERDGAEW